MNSVVDTYPSRHVPDAHNMLTVSEPSELLETTEEKVYNIRYAADNRNLLWAAGAFNFLVVIVLLVLLIMDDYNINFGVISSPIMMTWLMPVVASTLPRQVARNREAFVIISWANARNVIMLSNIAQVQVGEVRRCGKLIEGECNVIIVLKSKPNATCCTPSKYTLNIEMPKTFLEDNGLQAPSSVYGEMLATERL